MTTRHMVDPELIPLLDQFSGIEYNAEMLSQIREFTKAGEAQQLLANRSAFPDVISSEQYVPGSQDAPDVRVLIYRPKDASSPAPALLWMYAGGYVSASADQADLQLKSIVSAIGCIAVAVDYRLAPETPFPGPIEDCYAALRWLYMNARELGIDPTRIAIAGASAGGGLTAGLALLARDRGEVPLVFEMLTFPMLDDRTVTSVNPYSYTGEFVWTSASNRFGWTSLLGKEPGGPDISPYAAAARADKLEGLPPTFIAVGALDLFLREDTEYALRLIQAGVPTELHVYPGAVHAFPVMANAKIAQAYTQDYLNALARAFSQSE